MVQQETSTCIKKKDVVAQLAMHTTCGSPMGAHGCLGAGKRGPFPGGSCCAPAPSGRRARRGHPVQHLGQLPRGRPGWGHAGARRQPQVMPWPRTLLACHQPFHPPNFPARDVEQERGVGEGRVMILPCSCVFSGLGSICTAGFSCGLAQKTHFSFPSRDTVEKTKIPKTQVKNEQQRERNVRETKLKENIQ